MKTTHLFVILATILISISCTLKDNNSNAEQPNPTDEAATETVKSFCELDLEKYSFILDTISLKAFNEMRQKYDKGVEKTAYTDHLDSIKKILGDAIEFDPESGYLLKLVARNGKVLHFDPEETLNFIIAYFPEYDFLLLEGGHASEYGYSLADGEDIYEYGNPLYLQVSPKGTYRVTAIYSGQTCFTFLIQKKIDNKFRNIATMDEFSRIRSDVNICYFDTSFWTNDNTYYFSSVDEGEAPGLEPKTYYKMIVKEKQ